MKNLILLISLIVSISTLASEGIGGVIGGSGRTWQQEMKRKSSSYIGWPEVKHLEKPRSYKIHELCIKDDMTLATIKTIKQYSYKIVNWRLKRELISETRTEVERYFNSDRNCRTDNYHNCDKLNAYVEKEVEVPIYKEFKDDESSNLVHFLHLNEPKRVEKYTIPNCK